MSCNLSVASGRHICLSSMHLVSTAENHPKNSECSNHACRTYLKESEHLPPGLFHENNNNRGSMLYPCNYTRPKTPISWQA